jgi:peptidoglycan/LPS O-acetylase OafA/YrhL
VAPSVAQGRLYELDGLRGWAAVSVMLSHFLFGVFVKADPQVLTPLTKEFLEPLLGGTLDVAVFFVVSGEALSAPYWAKPSRKTVVRLAAKRYLRLTIPILASCLIVFALGKFGLLFHRQAASLLHVEDWLGTFLQKDFGVADLLGYAAVGVFCCHTQETSLNPFLGTMQAELLGSALVFGYLLLDRSIRPKSIILLVAFAICLGFDSFLACFPVGILCAYCRSRGAFHALSSRPFVQATANLSFSVALVIGTCCNRVWPGWLLPSIIASGVLVVSVHVSSPLRRLFATPFSRWLGYISFPLYLSHFPVIASFTSGTVVLAHAYGALGPAMMWLIIAISVALSFVTAMLFLPVEVLTARTGDFVVRVVAPEDYSGLAAQPLKKSVNRPGVPTPIGELSY